MSPHRLALLALAALVAVTNAQAQIAFRSASSSLNEGMGVQHSALGAVASATTATVTPALPARIPGDLLLTVIQAHHTGAVTMPAPNWTLLTTATQSTVQRASIFWRIATNTAADTATITQPAGQVLIARVVAFANVDPANPFDGLPSMGSSGGTGASVNTGTITTTNSCSILVATAHISDDPPITGAPTGANTWYQSYFSQVTTGADAAIGLWYSRAEPAGVQPSVSITHSNNQGGNDYTNAALFAIRPGGITLNVPAGTQAGDVMVATIATRPANSTPTNNNAKTVCEPPGWTLVRDTTNNLGGGSGGTGVRLQTYTRVATAADAAPGASHTWFAQINNPSLPPGTGGGQVFVSGTGGIASYSGVDGASPVNAEGGNTIDVKTFTHTANGITTTVANTMLVASHTFASADFWNDPPGGMTERVDQSAPAANNSVGISLVMSDEPWPTASATGNRTVVFSGTGGSNADEGVSHLMALRPGAAVHHYAVSVLSNTVANCDFAEVTITAHNAAHAGVNPPATRTVTLSVSAGAATAGWGTLVAGAGTWTPSGSTATYTWPGTQSSFTVRLRQSAVLSLTVNANDTFVTEDPTEDPTISFVNSAFRVSNGANTALAVGNQIAAKPSNTGTGSQSLFLQAIRTDTTTGACVSVFPSGAEVDINVGAQCNSPAACAQNVSLTTTSGSGSPSGTFVPAGAGTYPATIRFRFTTANAEAPFYFSYADAGQITLQFRHITAAPAVTIAGTSNAFVTRPFGLAFHGANSGSAIQHGTLPTSAVLAPAGDNFTMTLAAYRWASLEDDGTGNPLPGANLTDNGLTPNFASTTTVSATGNLPGVVTGAMTRGAGCAGAASIAAGSWSGGAATISDWCYDESGNVFMGASAVDYFGIAGFNVSGNSGLDGTGAVGGYVGRFRPKRFELIGTPAFTTRLDAMCASPSTFVYMDERIGLDTFRMHAVNTQSARTRNYDGTYALHVPDPGVGGAKAAFAIGARSGATDHTARISASHVLAPAWTQGLLEAPGAAPLQISLSFDRNATNTPDGPYPATSFGIAPTDGDGVSLPVYDLDVDNNATNDHLAVGTTDVRFGRLVMQSVYGPNNRDLPVMLETQYWSGAQFARNGDDSCTSFQRSDFALAFTSPAPPDPNLIACETAMREASITFASGSATLTLAQPGAGNSGTVRLTANLDAAGGNYCPSVGAGELAASNAAKGYLRGKWDGGAAYDDKPSAAAGFGLYGSQPSKFIYFRENY